MNKIKIAFFDVDGTLVDMESKKISKKTIETLKILKSKGILICMATGRPKISIPKFENIEFDAYLAFNGSYCYSDKGLIYKNSIPAEDVEKIIKNAKMLNRPVTLATVDRMGANGRDDDLADYFAIAGGTVEVADDFESLSKEEVFQIMSGGYKEEHDLLLKNVEGAEITAWWHRALDIIPVGGGKGVAVRKTLDYFGLDNSEAIAFGDGGNDIEMLKEVKFSVAMGNANEDVKSIANFVAKDVSEDGIYEFCKEYNLI